MRYAIKATINTGEYSNIQPEIELEGEDIASLHEQSMSHIKDVWRKYGIVPLKENDSNGQVVKTFTGEEIVYNDDTHSYFDLEGNKLVSGSEYAESVSPKFDKEIMIPKTANAWGVDEKELGSLWELQGTISASFGTAIHNAIEAYHLYHELGAKVQDKKELEFNYVLPKNEHLRSIVAEFDDKFGTEAEVEVMVSDIENKMAGRIDRLQVLDKKKKVCRVGDYKTNNELDDKKKLRYQHQLSFYAHILQNKGWVVDGLDIFHHNGEGWEIYPLDVLDLK